MSCTTVNIRVIYEGKEADTLENRQRDDLITIERIPDTAQIRVSFRDGRKPTVKFPLTLRNFGLPDYLVSLMRMLATDDDPVSSIQLMFPGFPSVVYDIDTIDKLHVQKLVKKICRMVQDDWFAELPEEADDEAEESEDTDDTESSTTASSMPSLEPPLSSTGARYNFRTRHPRCC